MANLFNKPLKRRNKARDGAAVDEALPPIHDHNTQQSSSLLIKNLQATRSNKAASKTDGLIKPDPFTQGQLRSARTRRETAPVRNIEDLENERGVFKYSKQVGLGKPWPR